MAKLSRVQAEAAARDLVAARYPDLRPGTPEHAERVSAHADFYERCGKDRAEFLLGVRPPRDRYEQWQADEWAGRITSDEHRLLWEADAERPVDAEMLARFDAAFRDRLERHIDAMRAVLGAATAGTYLAPEEYEAVRQRVTGFLDAAREKLPLATKQVLAVTAFLERVRVKRRLGRAVIDDYSALSAYWLFDAISRLAADGWAACRSDHPFGEDLPQFFGEFVRRLPIPLTMSQLMQEEYLHAEDELSTAGPKAAPAAPPPVTPAASPVPTSLASELPVTDPGPLVSQNDERDAWIHGRVCRGDAAGDILAGIKPLARERGWGIISTWPGLVRAAKSYARRKNLPPPPKRKTGFGL